jgi:hypothetical protein
MMCLMKLKEAVYLPIIDKAEHSAKKSHISYLGELGPKEATHPRKPATSPTIPRILFINLPPIEHQNTFRQFAGHRHGVLASEQRRNKSGASPLNSVMQPSGTHSQP